MEFEQFIYDTVASVHKKLGARHETVATAESCTAGLISYALTTLAGSSDFFKQGWVLYSEESKRREFLMPDAIAVYGFDCAKHLAKSARIKAGTTYGLGITGLTTPDHGEVWIGVASASGHSLKYMQFKGNRNYIQQHAAKESLLLLTAFINSANQPESRPTLYEQYVTVYIKANYPTQYEEAKGAWFESKNQ